jgi:hypothetical protein
MISKVLRYALFTTVLFQPSTIYATISGLAQETTTISNDPTKYYYPFGDGPLPLLSASGSPTSNLAYLRFPVSSTPPASQPTLVYNCQQMAAICQNVQNWLNAKGFTLPMEFTYDRTNKRGYDAIKGVIEKSYLPAGDKFSSIRRNQMCQGTDWVNTTCPNLNTQPGIIKSRFWNSWHITNVINDANGAPTRLIDGVRVNGMLTTPSGMRCE